jgi:serine/threonine protein phosphatase PrpC
MWKVISDSVQGTSHLSSAAPCQDACRVLKRSDPQPMLIAVCADGAGSASHAHVGAQTACNSFIKFFEEATPENLANPTVIAASLRHLASKLREELQAAATAQNTSIRELACTLLGAVVLDNCGVFVQIGDGVIIVLGANGYETVFWPQSGEYLNTTNFLTDATYADKLEVRIVEQRIEELALLTDGIELLALSLAEKSVFQPFFRPLFEALRASPNPEQLQEPLRQFLASDRVNERTDDDKTLILATRRRVEQG